MHMDNEIKQMFDVMLNKLNNIEQKQNNMEQGQKAMQTSVNTIDQRQDEIFTIVKAIEHSNTTHKAEIDNLTYKVAHTEGTINGEVCAGCRS